MSTRSIAIVKVIIAVVGFMASLITGNVFAAGDYTNVRVFVGDYDPSLGGIYIGAMEQNGAWVAIGWENDSLDRYEDDMQTDDDAMAIVDLYDNGAMKFNHNNKTFSFWRLPDDSTISDVTKNMNVTEALVNGRLAQVSNNAVNGRAMLVKEAGNPLTCTYYCQGWLIQNGNRVSFVYTVVENEQQLIVFIPMANN